MNSKSATRRDATSEIPTCGDRTARRNWLLVRGDVNTVGSGLPFNIETLEYFFRQIWNSVAGTAGIWTPAGLAVPVFAGDDNTVTLGFNNVTLPVPVTISTVGTARFWMGVINTYPAASVGVECTTCRVAGVDTVGNAAPTSLHRPRCDRQKHHMGRSLEPRALAARP